MRTTGRDGSLSVQAIAGTRCVLFGIDVDEAARAGLLGFAITKTGQGAPEPLDNFLLFKGNDVGAHADHSTLKNPLQTFLWGDYVEDPGQALTYTVTAMHGTSADLEAREQVELAVTTEDPTTGVNGVWLNRGVIGSQAYARKFPHVADPLSDPAARAWLSRGLLEALLAYIGQAAGPHQGLRCAFYEFANTSVLDALAAARANGADVAIVYDAEDDPAPIVQRGLDAVATTRANAPIPHNKFVVLLEDGAPVSVWTGSTNITDSGIYGQANAGHAIRDAAIAKAYLDYWSALRPDPLPADILAWTSQQNPDLTTLAPGGTAHVFSPQAEPGALSWYEDRIRNATSSAFITAPFGLNADLIKAIGAPGTAFRYAIVDSADRNVQALEPSPNAWATTGAAFTHTLPSLPWLPEAGNTMSVHIKYVHTKFLLVDPLSDDPIVVAGSANFSDNSTFANDENMLVLRGDTRVADIYLTEFMRLFTHFRFRYWTQHQPTIASGTIGAEPATRYLDETDGWSAKFFDPASRWNRERVVFRAP